jgi:hypothetical protein
VVERRGGLRAVGRDAEAARVDVSGGCHFLHLPDGEGSMGLAAARDFATVPDVDDFA